MTVNLSRQTVEHVAMLARLELTESEIETYTGQLNAILDHAEMLKKLDTDNVEPTAHAMPIYNVLRDDEIKLGIEQEKALANAPEAEDGFFRVPKIV